MYPVTVKCTIFTVIHIWIINSVVILSSSASSFRSAFITSVHLLCVFPSTLSLTFSFFHCSNLCFEELLPPHLVMHSLKTQIRLISTPFHIPNLSAICLGVCAPTAWPLCHQGSVFVPVAPMCAPQLGCTNPQEPVPATLLLVLSYRHYINSIYEVWISNIQLVQKLSDCTMGQEAAV